MNRCASVLISILLVACATAPAPEHIEHLFSDGLFQAPSERISADDVFALSAEMKHYLNDTIAGQLRIRGRRQALIDALYDKSQIQLEFDSAMTRTASQTFHARTGNCLSLVVMVAALAKELGVPVQYNNVLVEETWGRSGDIYMSIGHVNLTLGPRRTDAGFGRDWNDSLMIDFLPPRDIRGLHVRPIEEKTVVAMFMNNRAVESLAANQLDNAYWWSREAIRQDSKFLSAYNTLGAVYWRHGNAREAEHVLTTVLEREPGNTHAMSNLIPVLDDLGRVADATALIRRLNELEPYPPFSFFNRGMAAMQEGNFKLAKEMFAKEVDRAAYYHEFHFWLAIANLRVGEVREARKHLTLAIEESTTREERDLYAAKLAWIKTYRTQ